eukprot:TRINITY_DN8625_c0_g2_i6.p1 TRINITY_DN8625_c0_g2~~TRINITY_DN8625_c0_g2_i6.p1  ORF type:complete len:340 (+),score=96.18 TRINITY_DN8625_c0_g2_i6:36-1055(+)
MRLSIILTAGFMLIAAVSVESAKPTNITTTTQNHTTPTSGPKNITTTTAPKSTTTNRSKHTTTSSSKPTPTSSKHNTTTSSKPTTTTPSQPTTTTPSQPTTTTPSQPTTTTPSQPTSTTPRTPTTKPITTTPKPTTPKPTPVPSKTKHSAVVKTNGTVCLRFDYDNITIQYPDLNVAVGSDDVTGICTANVSQITLGVKGKLPISVVFTFSHNATTAQLEAVTALLNTTTYTINATSDNAFAASLNNSYQCNATFAYEAPKHAAKVVVTDVEVEAFMPSSAKGVFSPADSDIVCPANTDKSSKKIGLIVGGIITGLALFGIVLFAVTRCRGKSDYEAIN